MARHLTLKNTPPVMRDDEKAVEHSEGQRWHCKEIHCGDGFPMIAQKSRPSLGRLRTPRRSPHPAQYGSFRKIEAKHFQFAVDARCAPRGILRYHAKDQFAQFLAETFSAGPNPTPREPCPIQLEPCTVPANNGLWLDEEQSVLPFRPEHAQDHPEQLVGSRGQRRGFRCFKTTSCWRRAKFSSSRSRRERKTRTKRTATDLSRHSMKSVSYGHTRSRADLPTL